MAFAHSTKRNWLILVVPSLVFDGILNYSNSLAARLKIFKLNFFPCQKISILDPKSFQNGINLFLNVLLKVTKEWFSLRVAITS